MPFTVNLHSRGPSGTSSLESAVVKLADIQQAPKAAITLTPILLNNGFRQSATATAAGGATSTVHPSSLPYPDAAVITKSTSTRTTGTRPNHRPSVSFDLAAPTSSPSNRPASTSEDTTTHTRQASNASGKSLNSNASSSAYTTSTDGGRSYSIPSTASTPSVACFDDVSSAAHAAAPAASARSRTDRPKKLTTKRLAKKSVKEAPEQPANVAPPTRSQDIGISSSCSGLPVFATSMTMKDLPPLPEKKERSGRSERHRRERSASSSVSKSSRAPRLPKLRLGKYDAFGQDLFADLFPIDDLLSPSSSASPVDDFKDSQANIDTGLSMPTIDGASLESRSPLEAVVSLLEGNRRAESEGTATKSRTETCPRRSRESKREELPRLPTINMPPKERVSHEDALRMTEMWVNMLGDYSSDRDGDHSPVSPSPSQFRPDSFASSIKSHHDATTREYPQPAASSSLTVPRSSIPNHTPNHHHHQAAPVSPAPSSDCLDPTFLGPSPRTSTSSADLGLSSALSPLQSSGTSAAQKISSNPFEVSFAAAALNSLHARSASEPTTAKGDVQSKAPSFRPHSEHRPPPLTLLPSLPVFSQSPRPRVRGVHSTSPSIANIAALTRGEEVLPSTHPTDRSIEVAWLGGARAMDQTMLPNPSALLASDKTERSFHNADSQPLSPSESLLSALSSSLTASAEEGDLSFNSSAGTSYTSDTSFATCEASSRPTTGDGRERDGCGDPLTPSMDGGYETISDDTTPHAPSRVYGRDKNVKGLTVDASHSTGSSASTRVHGLVRSPTMEIVMYGMAL